MPIPALPRLGAATLAALCAWTAVPAAAASFEFGAYRVEVAADDGAVVSASDYQITVENADLMLSRLIAPYTGTLSRSFVSDLDADGSFEVVVTFTRDAGAHTDLHLYSWRDHRLERVPVAELDQAQQAGYRGGDEYAVRDGRLLRIFQLHEARGEQWETTAAQRRLRYSLHDSRWVEAP